MINIIGAGPAGSYAAYLLAKAGKEVQLFEEHNEIGKPVQCTGIVTSSLEKIIDFKLNKDIIINRIDKVKIFSPNRKNIELKLKNENLIIDRTKFDQFISERAKKAGAKISLNNRFMGIKNNSLIIKNQIKKITFNRKDTLIGADGPNSKVSSIINKNIPITYLTGLQARVKLKNQNYVEFYPYIGNFAWVVPENKDIVRIGVASYKNVKEYFNKILKIKRINKIINKQAGLIPIYNPKIKIQEKNIRLVGDAATQIKSTTGGGLVHGLTAAKILSNSIIKKENYEKKFNKKNKKDLLVHLYLRKIMDKFSGKDWDYLTKLFSDKKLREIIGNYDRDYPSKFILKLLLNEPRLLYFSNVMLKQKAFK